jgi:hypothetical protein
MSAEVVMNEEVTRKQGLLTEKSAQILTRWEYLHCLSYNVPCSGASQTIAEPECVMKWNHLVKEGDS